MSDRLPSGAAIRAAPNPKWAAIRRILKLVFTPIVIALAILYFVIDALVLSLVRPLMRRLAGWPPLARLTAWVATLGPYSTLLLVLIPIVLLEPLKPAAFYLIAKRHHVVAGTLLLAMTELVKIVAVERLFHLSRPKLMRIRAFAVVYDFVVGWLAYLEGLPPWQLALRVVAQAKAVSRRMAAVVRDLAD
ncbi:MAG: hypothetical protein JO128_15140 [Alphaproteobacteria bacterium]|nr:hypothetical protein [Alphaproteobacteria bacterium]